MNSSSNWHFTEHPVTGVDGRDLRLRVWQPAAVPPAAKPLPTLLLLDGQWLRDTITEALPALAGAPRLVASLGFNSPERAIIRPWRARDYTPRAPGERQCDPRRPDWPCGGAPELLAVLQDTVLPLLAGEYGADSQDLSLYGHSYAGLFSICAWLRQPALFRRVYAASPSLWWYWPHALTLLRESPAASQAPDTLPPLRLSVGDQERWRARPAAPGQPRPPGVPTAGFAREFLAALQAQGVRQASLQVVPGLEHGPMLAWSARQCLLDRAKQPA